MFPYSSQAAPSAGSATAVPETPRRAFRSSDERWLGGVASGLAHHLGLQVLWIRAGLLALVAFGGATYRVKEPHTSLPGWEPTKLPNLFQKI